MEQNKEKGQSIVIMAFAIIAMAALVGLAIDGGRLYTLRRRAQNAADSAAMAGTRELAEYVADCTPPDYADSGAVYAKVKEFVNLNGLDETTPDAAYEAWYVREVDGEAQPLAPVAPSGGIPRYTSGVSVSVVATDTTTFMSMFGVRHITAPGDATGMTGVVTALSAGLLPLGVPKPIVDALGEGESFYIKDNGDFCNNDDIPCDPEEENPPQAQRGWLQMGHIYNMDHGIERRAYTGSMGGNKCSDKVQPLVNHLGDLSVAGWANLDCQYPKLVYGGEPGYLEGDFIAGKPGQETDAQIVIEDIIDAGLGESRVAPIFDYIYTGTCQAHKGEICMETVFDDDEPDVGWMTGSTSYYYHIVGFVTVDLLGYNHSSHQLIAQFRRAIISGGEIVTNEGLGGGGCQELAMVGVVLWE